VARKNGNGEGSRPRQRPDGRWEARYWVGGKRRSVYGATRKEAADRLAKAIANGDEPRFESAAASITVRKFVAQYDDAVRDTMKRRSLETYRDITRLHLLPAFGDKNSRISPASTSSACTRYPRSFSAAYAVLRVPSALR
jgi:integrase